MVSYQGLVPGMVLGSTQMALCYPFDVVSTLMQTRQCDFRAAVRFAYTMAGVKGFYAGISLPLAAKSIKRGIQMQFLEQRHMLHAGPFMSGALAGALGTVVSCPQYAIMTRRQTQKASNIGQVFRQLGLRGLYRQAGWQMARDVPMSAGLLGGFACARSNGWCDTFPGLVGASAACSITTWSVLYPLDTVLTRRQNGQSWSNIKPSELYRGASVTLLRVGVVNTVALCLYETVRRRWLL